MQDVSIVATASILPETIVTNRDIGQRLIDGTAKKLSEEFFGNFSQILGGAAAPAVAPEQESAGLPPLIWISGLIIVIGVLLFIFAR